MHKLAILFVTFLTFSLATTAAPLAPAVILPTASALSLKSFAGWKREKIKISQDDLALARLHLEKAKSLAKSSSDPQLSEAIRSLTQAEWNVDAATDLSVADYVALYLSSVPNPNKLKEAASKLTAEDTMSLLESYLQVLHNMHNDSNPVKIPRHSRGEED